MKAIWAVAGVALIALAAPTIARTPDNRAVVQNFVERVYVKRDVAGAFAAHVAADYIQHDPGQPDGQAAAVEALAPMFARPGSCFDLKHVLVDGDLALVHLFGQGKPDTAGAAVADIYRLEGGKIVEHWDVIQPIEPGTDPLAQAAQPDDKGDTARNRQVFDAFIDLLFMKGDVEAAYDRFVAPDLVQHNSRLGRGRADAVAAITALRAAPGAIFSVQRTLVDGNFAAVSYRGKLSANDKGAAIVEIFRFDDRGMIVEHWDMFQPLP
ncbi:nuclear transport factor 2 family protein [Sphingobium sp.]|uniref:nuclear transport factor 2 family protein n=1 Tax=Sphingobium sp. TaxID=1912891 RepID=UPI00262D6409|nr:nuclear transport factor 2 family protein [Sphingobium sp.]